MSYPTSNSQPSIHPSIHESQFSATSTNLPSSLHRNPPRLALGFSPTPSPQLPFTPPLRLQTFRCLPRFRPSQLHRSIIPLRFLRLANRARARHRLAPQIRPVPSPCGAVDDGAVRLAGRSGGAEGHDLQRRGRLVVLVVLFCEEGDATVFGARLEADGLRGDVAVILV